MSARQAPAVNGWALPPALVAAMRDGRWKVPGPAALERVFGEAHEYALFYSPEQMQRENARWPATTHPAYLGRPDPARPPGTIDPTRSVLIGDVGPDRPIALDYRGSPQEPSVLYLGTSRPSWVRVTRSFGELLRLLDQSA
jgi:hypothetical protein